MDFPFFNLCKFCINIISTNVDVLENIIQKTTVFLNSGYNFVI